MPIYSTDKAYISYAIGTTDLTAWRNGDAVLVAGELQATDILDALKNISVDYSDPETIETGHMSSSHYTTRLTTGYKVGRVVFPSFLQTGVLLYATLGTCTTSRTGKEITSVTCVAASEITTGDYFLINCVNGAGATVNNYVWFNKAIGGGEPSPGGTGLMVAILADDPATTVATNLRNVMDTADYYDASVADTIVTITTENNGAVEDASDVNTDFSISVTTQGASTHAISLKESQTPIRFAFHFKKELSGNNIEYDFLGYMPDYWKLTCGDDKGRWKARQEFSGEFAYTRASGGDLDESSKLKTHKFEWNDLKHASGVLTVKYNGTELEFIQRSLDLTVTRTRPLWGVKGASGFPIEAFIAGVGIEYVIEGYLKGNNVRTLMATKPEDYAGSGLDVEIKFFKGANNEFGVSLGNLYLIPDETILNENDWYERKTLRMVPISSTTTITSSVEDRQNKTYYEND